MIINVEFIALRTTMCFPCVFHNFDIPCVFPAGKIVKPLSLFSCAVGTLSKCSLIPETSRLVWRRHIEKMTRAETPELMSDQA